MRCSKLTSGRTSHYIALFSVFKHYKNPITKIQLDISLPLRPMLPESLRRSLPNPASVNSPLLKLKFSVKSQMVHSVSLEKHGWTDSGTARISHLYAWGSWGREEVKK